MRHRFREPVLLILSVVLMQATAISAPTLVSWRRPLEVYEQSFVRIGGIEQWIDVRGDGEANPVLLVLHGGPGSTWDPLVRLFKPWEKYFTLVEWDQRGAGRTYSHNSPDSAAITLDRVVQDGIEVAEYVARRLDKRKVVLMGHSWGTLVGVQMVKARPELFCAYVGTSQVVNTQKSEALSYAEVLRRARLAHNAKAVEELESIGGPPYDDAQKLGTERQWEAVFAAPSEQKFNSIDYVRSLYPPDFTDKEMTDRNAGFFASNYSIYGHKMDGPMMSVDLSSTARDFRLPMFFIQGALDDVTPTSIVREYVHFDPCTAKGLGSNPGSWASRRDGSSRRFPKGP